MHRGPGLPLFHCEVCRSSAVEGGVVHCGEGHSAFAGAVVKPSLLGEDGVAVAVGESHGAVFLVDMHEGLPVAESEHKLRIGILVHSHRQGLRSGAYRD